MTIWVDVVAPLRRNVSLGGVVEVLLDLFQGRHEFHP